MKGQGKHEKKKQVHKTNFNCSESNFAAVLAIACGNLDGNQLEQA